MLEFLKIQCNLQFAIGANGLTILQDKGNLKFLP